MFNQYEKLNDQAINNLTNNYRQRLANPYPLSRMEVATSISNELFLKQSQGLIPFNKVNKIKMELGL